MDDVQDEVSQPIKTAEPAVVPVAPNTELLNSVVIRHLGIEIANYTVELAKMRAQAVLVLQAYEALNIETWVREVVHHPHMGDGSRVRVEGPIIIPAEEHEALSRFLAAVEQLS
jgi:hypothetical protein